MVASWAPCSSTFSVVELSVYLTISRFLLLTADDTLNLINLKVQREILLRTFSVKLTEWMAVHKLKLNTTKTVCLPLTRDKLGLYPLILLAS